MTLVETVKNRMNFNTSREAIEYIFSEVATESGEDDRRLNIEHLEYLFDGAIFEHKATGKKSTIADGDFKFKDTLNSIMQNAEIQRANEVQQSNNADSILAKDEYNQFIQANPNVSPLAESNFLRELEAKYPSFDASTLNSGSGNTGGAYDGRAGKPDATYDYKADLTTALVGEENPNRDQFFEIERAYGDLQRRVANQVAVGVKPEVAEANAYKVVEQNLQAGKYKNKILPREISPSDILADNQLLRGETNKTRFNSNYNSLREHIEL